MKVEAKFQVSCCILWLAAFSLLWTEAQDSPLIFLTLAMDCQSISLSAPLCASSISMHFFCLFFYALESSGAQVALFPKTAQCTYVKQRLCGSYMKIFAFCQSYLWISLPSGFLPPIGQVGFIQLERMAVQKGEACCIAMFTSGHGHPLTSGLQLPL